MTPLLDWTESAYVASFFAWMDYWRLCNPGLGEWGALPHGATLGSVAVWEVTLSADDCIPEELDLFTALVDGAYRQKAQRGVFTMLSHEHHLDLESYLGSRGKGSLLTKYEMPGAIAYAVMPELAAMNLSYSTLFPDLDGAARQANMHALLELFGTIRSTGSAC